MNAANSWSKPTPVGFSWPVTEIAAVDMSSPMSIEPASPMKSFAGCQLSGRKPAQAPTSTIASSDARLK